MAAAPALAQDRTPTQRQALADLAYALGQSHSLRQVCRGEADQYWRARMQQLFETESPEQGLAVRLGGAFNAGYAEAQAGHPSCSTKSKRAAAKAAAKGRSLAEGLATP